MDFSHHRKLCNKTQHAQLYKNKSILKLLTWFCFSRALKHVCKNKHRRNSTLVAVQQAPAPADLMSSAKKHFLATIGFFPPSMNSLALNPEYFCGLQGTGLWQAAWPVLSHPRQVPCRNIAATKAEKDAFLNWTPSTQNSSQEALYLHVRVGFFYLVRPLK